MKRTTSTLTTLAALLAAAAGPVSATAPQADGAAPAPAVHRSAPAITRVVLRVSGCEGCSMSAHSYGPGGADAGLWSSGSRRVRDGRVVFRIATQRTQGMTVALSAPWERHVGAVGQVVFRYAGQAAGDRVSTSEARAARRGSPCFSGTESRRLRLKVSVHRAHFRGAGGRAVAAAAHTQVSQRTVGPLERTYDGFLGSQDVVPCFRS